MDILRLAEYSSTKTSDKESITIGISLAQVCLRAEAFRSMAASGKAVPEDKVEFITEGYKEMVSLRKLDSETIASACKFILGVELGAPFQKIIWGDMLLDIEKLSTILIKSTCDKLDREAGKFEKLLVGDDVPADKFCGAFNIDQVKAKITPYKTAVKNARERLSAMSPDLLEQGPVKSAAKMLLKGKSQVNELAALILMSNKKIVNIVKGKPSRDQLKNVNDDCVKHSLFEFFREETKIQMREVPCLSSLLMLCG